MKTSPLLWCEINFVFSNITILFSWTFTASKIFAKLLHLISDLILTIENYSCKAKWFMQKRCNEQLWLNLIKCRQEKPWSKKNSTFVIVIQRQIVAKKKSYAFFRQQCKCPGLASLWLWFLKKKAGCPPHSCVVHTFQKSTSMVGQNAMPVWTDWVWRNC